MLIVEIVLEREVLQQLELKLSIDAFIVYTNNEMWFGEVHPVEALTYITARPASTRN